MASFTSETRGLSRVVIIGGGFGGLWAARALRGEPVRVTVIDRTNHHLFQPLLYQVATATLAPTDIAAPVRWLLRNQENAEVLMASVAGIEPGDKSVKLDDGSRLAYDYLIVASGARHSYFSHPEWEQYAPGLKSIEDAIDIRRRFLRAFEQAERCTDPAERQAWLTFVIVGGGPTGVELAGMLPTITDRALRPDFRAFDPALARVILVEAGPRVLPTFPEDLSEHAAADLKDLRVDVRTSTMVTGVDGEGVEVGAHHERILAKNVFWAAGNAASPLGRMLGAAIDRMGRVKVNPDLSVPDHPEVFVVGDLATVECDGKPVPGVAPAAMQMGRAAARNILHSVRREGRADFRYRNKGDLATIGRYKAVAVIAGQHLSGNIAWWTWLFVHILYLAGFRSRLSVLVEWGYSFFTYERGARLITDR